MKDGKLCISADSHVVESAEFFEPLVKRFGSEAPHVVVADPERGPQLYIGNGQLGLTIAGFLQANVDFTSPDARAMLKQGYKLARPGCYDVAERLKDQDIDGLDGEVVYPSVLFNVYQVANRDILNATFSSYNDWVADYCKEAPDRLFALSCLQLYDLDEAISEMDRAKQLGCVGTCIPASAPPSMLYADKGYDKFWAAAQEMEQPLNMHIFTGATPNHGLPFRQAGSPLAFAGVMFTIADLIQSGVCERFPRLKFVITEFEAGWTAIMLKRLDWAYLRGGGQRVRRERGRGRGPAGAADAGALHGQGAREGPLGLRGRDQVRPGRGEKGRPLTVRRPRRRITGRPGPRFGARGAPPGSGPSRRGPPARRGSGAR